MKHEEWPETCLCLADRPLCTQPQTTIVIPHLQGNEEKIIQQYTIFVEIDNRNTAEELVNEDLNHIHNWAINWLITFSAPKAKHLM